MDTEVCPIRNPEVWRLDAQAEPLRQDRQALQRLIVRGTILIIQKSHVQHSCLSSQLYVGPN